ncbi:MAG: hypothetical protein LBK40_04010, partial [Spirochaetaceae bacterium]|nr:hypothetical protein [Spirochaetaceae bacterium]
HYQGREQRVNLCVPGGVKKVSLFKFSVLKKEIKARLRGRLHFINRSVKICGIAHCISFALLIV